MDTRTPKSAREDALAGSLAGSLVGCCCLSGGSSGHGRPRLAKLLADDMRKGGGLVPRMLPGPGLEFGPDLRSAQFACNIIAGV